GEVLDPLARRPLSRDTGRVKFLETLRDGTREQVLTAMVERAPMGLRYDEIAAHTGWRETEIRETIKHLSSSKVVKSIGEERPLLISAGIFESLSKAISEKIDYFQRENPLMPGITREELRSSIGRRVKPEVFRAALAELIAQKKLEGQGEIVKRAGSGITLQPDERAAKDKIEAAFRAGGLT